MSGCCVPNQLIAYVRPAAGGDGAYWFIGPGSAGLAQGCRCALPLQGAGACCGGLPHSLLFSVVQVYMHCNFASELCIHTDWLNKLKLVESLSFACNLSRMRRDYLSIQEICNSRCDFEQAGNRIASKCTKPCQSPGGYSSVLCHIIYVRKLARNVSRAGQNSA